MILMIIIIIIIIMIMIIIYIYIYLYIIVGSVWHCPTVPRPVLRTRLGSGRAKAAGPTYSARAARL